ncbi:MAG: FAD-binding oxidoreductase, partial [Acidimicrobiia bacterium]|nr:FAD-binding oxidoreductase [Acidimicrobiia bacterium]
EVEDAAVVVNAAGAWCDVVGAMAGLGTIGLQPKRRTAFTFAAPNGLDHRGWPMVVEAEHDFYFRPEGPSLLGSPGDQTPVEPQDIKHEEIDVALAIDRIQSVTTMRIRTVQSAWAGLRSFVPDGLPVAGFEPATDGFFWLAGQGGYGILSSPAMARLAAALIVDGVAPPSVTSFGLDPARIGPSRLSSRS